jgi:hypothetical protein
MDQNFAIGICAGVVLIVLIAATTTDVLREVADIPGRLLNAAVKLQERLLQAFERKPWPPLPVDRNAEKASRGSSRKPGS